ncbi:dTDP-4-amino-4,6-dideoxygalactose transaminase [Sulfuriflexus mobilis]|uniref:dTDP-4-amino-4,6-dideoxygalactose transaminase n=1 Tax=Sulfuriflexus mobilis TaxID=1811807 RepID=UPI000F82BA23|nr:dTDP-4-amino-4,6-dideoxygalactose transaminase [Sulfuriflexus mobilis]
MSIPFSCPTIGPEESAVLVEVVNSGRFAGGGNYTDECHRWLENNTGCSQALLTQSCTTALEMAACLINIQPGDEVIMPSYTFVSTANAIALRGGVPVFVDIREDTLNIDESRIEEAIGDKTRAILPVHYAGVACEMDYIMDIAKANSLSVIEDAAQGICSTYKGRSLGSIGDMGAYSFHETKNIVSGEGGALLINNEEYIEEAEIFWEKGTDRRKFFTGKVDKYTWKSIGSSCLPSEITAALLTVQLGRSSEITRKRIKLWDKYYAAFKDLEETEKVVRPCVPADCDHNGHIFYLLFPSMKIRDRAIGELNKAGISVVFHYIPLHESPAGKKYAKNGTDLSITSDIASRIVRLPLYAHMSYFEQETVITAIQSFCSNY